LQLIDAKFGFGEGAQLRQLFFALRARAFCLDRLRNPAPAAGFLPF